MANDRKKPGVGHNSGLPDHQTILECLAAQVIMDQKMDALRQQRKTMRKGFESKTVSLEDLDRLNKMKDLSPSEIEGWLKRQANIFGAVFTDLNEQFDMFAPKAGAPERRGAYRIMGRLAAINGKECKAPPNVQGDDLQQFIEGHAEGVTARNKAMADALAAADAEKKDGKPKGESVNDKAARQFSEDNGDDPLMVAGEKYENMRQANAARKRLKDQIDAATEAAEAGCQPDWKGYDDDPAKWSITQNQVFGAWYGALQPSAEPIQIEPAGVRKAYEARVAAEQSGGEEIEPQAGQAPRDTVYRLSSDEPTDGRVPTYKNGDKWSTVPEDSTSVPIFDEHPADDGFEMTEEERSKQAGRKSQSQEAAERREEAGVN